MADDENYERVRVKDGWLDFHRDDEGVWRISVLPDPLPGEKNPPAGRIRPGT
jgi:hypothetical protein